MTVRTIAGALALAALVWAAPGAAQTLTATLAAAYNNNPELNVERSRLRATDEQIAIARSGNRPTIGASLDFTNQTTRIGGGRGIRGTGGSAPVSVALSLTQPIFNGFQTRNNIRQAESAVKAGRASLENTEQSVLLDAATAFYDVIQNRQIVSLRESDVAFLGEQIRAAQDRFEVGEGTRTDVSQAEARQAVAQSAFNFALANVAASEARFRQFTGLTPNSLREDFNPEQLIPPSLEAAVEIGQQGHPAIFASLFDVDTALFNVKSLEGEFLPSLNVVGQVGRTFNQGGGVDFQDQASIGLNLDVPIYQGGRVSAQVRQAKEQLGTQRIQVDLVRDQVRQNTVQSWASYIAATQTIFSSRTGVFAAQLALQGVIEEQRVGQRTTLDVLDAQRDVIGAQVTLIQSERDREVAAFTLLAAIGRLSAARLSLPVDIYVPEEHTDAVRDKWYGFRTPDGR